MELSFQNCFDFELKSSFGLKAMLTLLIAALILAAIIAAIGLGGVTIEIGKVLFSCAVVLVLISAVVGIVRGKARA